MEADIACTLDYLGPPRISLEILTQALSMQNIGQPGEFMNTFRETEVSANIDNGKTGALNGQDTIRHRKIATRPP